MKADFFKKYQLGSSHLSESNVIWSERAVQQVWFEGWLRESLSTVDGQPLSIIQPGIWKRGAGPDFRNAAIFYGNDKVRSGDVEVDMRPQDWVAHGHDRNPIFNNVMLHAVWELSKKKVFTATENFTHVPQVELRSQLAVDETALRNLLNENDDGGGVPLSLPGACRREFQKLGAHTLLNVLKDAARYRLERKGHRWHLRASAVGKAQALWEALAEGMGYHENKLAFSLLSRRARIKDLSQLDSHARAAWLWGVANLLPEAEARIKDPAVSAYLKNLWSYWWKLRPNLVDCILPKDLWIKSQVRPWNQPLRRLAGLCALSNHIDPLLKALEKGKEQLFTNLLLSVEDSFWNQRLSWRGKKLDRTIPLIGADRARELSINIFWPLMLSRAVAKTPPQSEDPHLKRLESIRCSWNYKTRIAYDRIVPPSIKKQALENALFQQGLLQLYEDYCVRDESACANCPLPSQIA
jgi:hypothetical protein